MNHPTTQPKHLAPINLFGIPRAQQPHPPPSSLHPKLYKITTRRPRSIHMHMILLSGPRHKQIGPSMRLCHTYKTPHLYLQQAQVQCLSFLTTPFSFLSTFFVFPVLSFPPFLSFPPSFHLSSFFCSQIKYLLISLLRRVCG